MSVLLPKQSEVPEVPNISDRIFAARLVCVLFMMYVHVPSGIDRGTIAYTFEFGRFDHWLEAFLIEGPGRAGAALLSLVSGYLVATTLMRSGSSATALYARRFKSTMIPMLFWGLLVYSIYSLISQIRPTFLTDLSGWLAHINVVLFLTDVPYGPTMHLAFLRDLFVCVLLSPLLLLILRRAAWPLLALLAWIYIFRHDQQLYIILRPLVLFAFTGGMLLALRSVRMNALDGYGMYFLGASFFCTFLIMWVNGGGLPEVVNYLALREISLTETVLYPCCRVFGSLAIWTLLPNLLKGRVPDLVKRYSAYLFAAFCSHHLVLTIVFHAAWQPIFGGRESAVYLAWFVIAPILAFVVAMFMVKAAVRFVPYFGVLLTGGRLPVKQRADHNSLSLKDSAPSPRPQLP